MSKPSARLLPSITSNWTEQRSLRVRAGLAQRARRHRLLGRTGIGAVAAATLIVGFWFLQRRFITSHEPVAVSPTIPAAPRETPDQTALLDPDTEVVPEPEPDVRAFRLRKGAARFTVSHDVKRPFRVHVGTAVIEDLGTVFVVRRTSGSLAEVAVDQGRVRVTAVDGSFDLEAGARRTFDTGDGSVEAAPDHDVHEVHAPAIAAWRPLAESGRYKEAYASMKAGGRSGIRDETGELLLAADVARLSGHPADAVPFLEQILKSRGGDPRAGLVAFTLGRVLIDDLGRPAEAAAAFERARKAGGPLSEDALGREVEAFSRAGDTSRARTLALEFQRIYPHARRARAVAKFGGLD